MNNGDHPYRPWVLMGIGVVGMWTLVFLIGVLP
jgi:hypothetical protein